MMKISVRVITNAKAEKIEENGGDFKVWLKSKPVENTANKTLIKFIAKHFQVPKRNVKIVSGLKSRNKILEVFSDGA